MGLAGRRADRTGSARIEREASSGRRAAAAEQQTVLSSWQASLLIAATRPRSEPFINR